MWVYKTEEAKNRRTQSNKIEFIIESGRKAYPHRPEQKPYGNIDFFFDKNHKTLNLSLIIQCFSNFCEIFENVKH